MPKFILTSLLIILGISDLYACRCHMPESVEQAFNATSLVIHGKVLSKEFISYEQSMNSKGAEKIRALYSNDSQKIDLLESKFIVKVELIVIEKFKGEISNDKITLYTTRTSASCGFTRFEIGKEYIIYGNPDSYAFEFFNSKEDLNLEKEGTFWTNHCTLTSEKYEQDIKVLRAIAGKI